MYRLEAETMDDEIKVLEVVKESIDEEMCFEMNEDATLAEENDEHVPSDESMGEIDNSLYTFVSDTKTSGSETEIAVEMIMKPFQQDTEVKSSNDNEVDKQMTKENEHDSDKSVNEIDNGWYTFVANDKNCDSGIYLTLENKEIVVELTKKRPYQCTICQKAFQNSNNLESHIKIHTGEVPFECKTCSKRFRTKYALKKHERIHI